jgi:molybdopterin molybdotransferase
MTTTLSHLINNPSCMADYDPNAMSVKKARAFIKTFLSPIVDTETIDLTTSLGRILATDILSSEDVPNYDNSAMDGYAFAFDSLQDGPDTKLKVVGTAFAGQAFEGKVNHGECVRIMTGGALPFGTDSVIMQEKVVKDTLDDIETIQCTIPVKKGMNVRYTGEDLKSGQTVLATGHTMRAADLGLIASLGIAKITVYRKLKVAFFSTGDELAAVGKPLKTGQVYDSNRYSLFGMLSRLNVEMIDFGAIPDNPTQLETTLLAAANQADVVITSGGVSVGEADYMKTLLAKHGEVMFWKVNMKPGRPLAFGQLKKEAHQLNNEKLNRFDPDNEKLNGFSQTPQAHYFGLPGNPVAVMVTFYQFVREALFVLMGQPNPPSQPTFQVICTEAIKKMAGRTEYQRGMLFEDTDGTWKVKPTGAQGSAILSSMSRANCFIVLDEPIGNLEAGATVTVQVLDGIV